MGLQQISDRPAGSTRGDLRVDLRPGTSVDAGVVVEVEAHPDAATVRAWDRLVARTPQSDVAQLSAWAQVRGEAGFAPLWVVAREAGKPVGGAMVLHRRAVPGLGSVAYLPFGPVLPSGARRAEARDAIGRALADLARDRFAALFVQPMAGDSDVTDCLLRCGFRPSTAGITPAASVAIDLSQPVERLRAGLGSGTRGSIARATAQGVRVRTGDENDLPAVAALLAHTADHHGFPAASPERLRAMYRALAPGHLQILLAERDGRPLAVDVLTICGGVLTLRLTGMRRDEDTRKSGAAALLRWETMLWARANDHDGYDLGGIPAAAVDAVRAGRSGLAARVDGRTYYKASFGGRAFHYPGAVELLPSAPLRLGYDLTRRSAAGQRLLRAARTLLRRSTPSR